MHTNSTLLVVHNTTSRTVTSSRPAWLEKFSKSPANVSRRSERERHHLLKYESKLSWINEMAYTSVPQPMGSTSLEIASPSVRTRGQTVRFTTHPNADKSTPPTDINASPRSTPWIRNGESTSREFMFKLWVLWEGIEVGWICLGSTWYSTVYGLWIRDQGLDKGENDSEFSLAKEESDRLDIPFSIPFQCWMEERRSWNFQRRPNPSKMWCWESN